MLNSILKSSFIAVILSLVPCGCFRQELVTVEISVPEMGSPVCATLVSGHLRPEKYTGITGPVLADHQTRTVKITYNSTQISLKNIEHLIAEIGFDANSIPGNSEARKKLPGECR